MVSEMSYGRPDLVVVGSTNVDMSVDVIRIPRPGDTVLGSDTQISPGGKGANVAVAAARNGATVAFVGAVGADDHGAFLTTALQNEGVDTTLLRRVDRPTGAAYITVDADGQNAIVVSAGANAAVTAEHVDAAAQTIAAAPVTFSVLEVPMDAVVRAAEHARRMVVNASPVRSLPDALLSTLDPLIVNRAEAVELVDAADATDDELLDGLLDMGVRSAVVTAGAAGAIAADQRGQFTAAAPKVDVQDTTGAGDALSGALCHHLASGRSLRDALAPAVAAAAESVTRRGAQG